MFCPNCGAEYREGFTHCSDCDVDLVFELPKDKPADSQKEKLDDLRLVPVLKTGDLTDVMNIKALLDSEGVEYILQGDNMSVIDPYEPAVLLVKENDVEHVNELLKRIKINHVRFIFDKKQYK